MSKRIQPKLSRPRSDVIFDAACAAAFSAVDSLLNCLALSKSKHILLQQHSYYQERAYENAVSLCDYAALAGGVFTPEWFLNHHRERERLDQALIEEALALVAGGMVRKAVREWGQPEAGDIARSAAQ